jgi:hypothetical protein
MHGETKNTYKISLENLKEEPLGRPRRRWEDNISMYLKATGWEVVDCIHLVLDRVQRQTFVETVMNLRVS